MQSKPGMTCTRAGRLMLLAAGALLAGCMAGRPGAASGPQALARLLVGDFFSTPGGGARAERPIYLRVRRVDSPLPGTLALYSEMRHDGPDGELYRQRLYLLDERSGAPLVMKSLGFADPEAAARLVTNPALLVQEGLRLEPALAEGCDTTWSPTADGFLGLVDPATCVITGRRGDRRRIEGRTLIHTGAIGQLERGYDLDGRLLFGNPTGELYVWPRVR